MESSWPFTVIPVRSQYCSSGFHYVLREIFQSNSLCQLLAASIIRSSVLSLWTRCITSAGRTSPLMYTCLTDAVFLPSMVASSVRILFPYIFYSCVFVNLTNIFGSLTHMHSFERNLLAGSLGEMVERAIVLEDNNEGLELGSAKWQMGTLNKFINQLERPPLFGQWDNRMSRPSLHYCSCHIMRRWLLV